MADNALSSVETKIITTAADEKNYKTFMLPIKLLSAAPSPSTRKLPGYSEYARALQAGRLLRTGRMAPSRTPSK
jgi:hypothetical protein